MNLLAYTKKLYEKIRFYDSVLKNKNFDDDYGNPFREPLSITIIWFDNDDEKYWNISMMCICNSCAKVKSKV